MHFKKCWRLRSPNYFTRWALNPPCVPTPWLTPNIYGVRLTALVSLSLSFCSVYISKHLALLASLSSIALPCVVPAHIKQATHIRVPVGSCFIICTALELFHILTQSLHRSERWLKKKQMRNPKALCAGRWPSFKSNESQSISETQWNATFLERVVECLYIAPK